MKTGQVIDLAEAKHERKDKAVDDKIDESALAHDFLAERHWAAFDRIVVDIVVFLVYNEHYEPFKQVLNLDTERKVQLLFYRRVATVPVVVKELLDLGDGGLNEKDRVDLFKVAFLWHEDVVHVAMGFESDGVLIDVKLVSSSIVLPVDLVFGHSKVTVVEFILLFVLANQVQ